MQIDPNIFTADERNLPNITALVNHFLSEIEAKNYHSIFHFKFYTYPATIQQSLFLFPLPTRMIPTSPTPSTTPLRPIKCRILSLKPFNCGLRLSFKAAHASTTVPLREFTRSACTPCITVSRANFEGVLYLPNRPYEDNSLLFQLASELVSLKVSPSELTLSRLCCLFGENLFVPG
jgi:hypothetical protein